MSDELTDDERAKRHAESMANDAALIRQCQDGLYGIAVLINAARSVDMTALLHWPGIHQHVKELTWDAGHSSMWDDDEEWKKS